MIRFALNFRQVCVISILMAIGLIVISSSILLSSSWNVLSDRNDSEHMISNVQFVREFPISQKTTDELVAGAAVPSFPIKIFRSGLHGRTRKPFKLQVKESFDRYGAPLSGDLRGKKYAFYVDIPKAKFKNISNPYIYYYLVLDPYQLFINGKLVRSVKERRGDLGAAQIHNSNERDIVRVVWVANNSRSNRIGGLYFWHGLSIQSEISFLDKVEYEKFRSYFPHLVTSVAFFIIAIIALGFAFSTKKYLDIWVFSTFSMILGAFIWSKIPIFYWEWGWDDNGKLLATIRCVLAALVVLSAVVLSMSFFRLEGRHFYFSQIINYMKKMTFKTFASDLIGSVHHPFRMILILTASISAWILYVYWPISYNGAGYPDHFVNARLAYLLVVSQLCAFYFGYRSLFQLRNHYIKKDLSAQVKLMNQRLATSVLFTVGMGIMLYYFGTGLKGVTNAMETDLILIAAVAPAAAMLLMFFWMVSSASRFYQKFAPRLGQIDHEVLAFGEQALQKRYYGCLLVFDLKGMKKLNQVRSQSAELEHAIDHLLYNVEHSLSELIQKGRITFKYKSNGDEFIFNMRAKDKDGATDLMVELTSLWERCATGYLAAWRRDLRRDLEGHLATEIIDELIEGLDIHVLITTLLDMKITVKGGIHEPTANPDFIDPRFTALTAIFKPSRHNKIAMFEDDARTYLSRSGSLATYAAEGALSKGFLSFAQAKSEKSHQGVA